MGYKAKYLINYDKGEVKGYEVSKIINNVSRETSRVNPVSILTAILTGILIVYLSIR